MKGENGTDTGQFDVDLFIWKDKYKEWVDKAKNIEEGNKNLYYLLDKQWSPGMKSQVEGLSGYKIIKAEQDSIKHPSVG